MNLYRVVEARRILVVEASLRLAISMYLNRFEPDETLVSGLVVERLEPGDRLRVIGEGGDVLRTTVAELAEGGPSTYLEYRPEAPAGPDVGRPGVAQP